MSKFIWPKDAFGRTKLYGELTSDEKRLALEDAIEASRMTQNSIRKHIATILARQNVYSTAQ